MDPEAEILGESSCCDPADELVECGDTMPDCVEHTVDNVWSAATAMVDLGESFPSNLEDRLDKTANPS